MLSPESGMTLIEILLVMFIMGVLSVILYDLSLSILTSNLLIEVRSDLSSQGQQALNQIKNRLISSRLLLADQYNKTSSTWTAIGSHYVNLLEASSKYPPLPTLTPDNMSPGGDYCNVIARIESRTVGSETHLVTLLVPPDATQPELGLSARSIGNSMLFIENLPARQVRHTTPTNATADYLVDTYRLNYYYLYQKAGDPIAGKDYYVSLIQWESQEFADYAQILQIATYLKQEDPLDTPTDILDQLKNPAISPFPEEKSKNPLTYAWEVGKAATLDAGNIAGSIRGNFYNLIYNSVFDPTDDNLTNDIPLTGVASSFLIPQREAIDLLAGLYTGATQGRVSYTIAFNNDASSNSGLLNPIPQTISYLVPIRFNPYDTNNFAHPKFMGGLEIGIIPNITVGYQVNLRLVLMAASATLRRMISNEEVVLVATRG